jgi:hypothetical protein
VGAVLGLEINNDLPHAYLDSNGVSIPEQLVGILSLIKVKLGGSVFKYILHIKVIII